MFSVRLRAMSQPSHGTARSFSSIFLKEWLLHVFHWPLICEPWHNPLYEFCDHWQSPEVSPDRRGNVPDGAATGVQDGSCYVLAPLSQPEAVRVEHHCFVSDIRDAIEQERAAAPLMQWFLNWPFNHTYNTVYAKLRGLDVDDSCVLHGTTLDAISQIWMAPSDEGNC